MWAHPQIATAVVEPYNAVVCVSVKEFFPEIQSCINFECTGQRVIGLGSTHMRGGQSEVGSTNELCFHRRDSDAGGPMHEECAITVQEGPNLHLSSCCVMSQVKCGHLGHFLLLSVKQSDCTKFRSTVLHVIEST